MPFCKAILQCRFARSVAEVLPLRLAYTSPFTLSRKTLNLRLSVALYGDRDDMDDWDGWNDWDGWDGWDGWNDWNGWNDPHDLNRLVNDLNT